MLLRIGQQNVKRAVHAVTIVHEGQEKESITFSNQR